MPITSIDCKEKVITDLETALKLVTVTHGYNFNLKVLEGVDWATADQIDKGELPIAFINSETIDNLGQDSNVPNSIVTTLEIMVYAAKDRDEGDQSANRTMSFTIKKNISKALFDFVKMEDLEINKDGRVMALNFKSRETDTGWSGDMVIGRFILALEYEEAEMS